MLRHLVDFFRDSGGLLIFDEAQHLSLAALETIRAIYDEAGMGLALVGNDIVYSRLKGGGDTALFAQIYSRIGKRVALKAVDDTDAERFAAAFGVTEPTAVTDLQAIAKKPGALRGVVKTLRLAAMFARGAGETLSTTHIKTAWRELGGAQ
jgi:DNA transposition AAA+ family ATPase